MNRLILSFFCTQISLVNSECDTKLVKKFLRIMNFPEMFYDISHSSLNVITMHILKETIGYDLTKIIVTNSLSSVFLSTQSIYEEHKRELLISCFRLKNDPA